MRKACVLFPGQGFQKFGMLKSLAEKHPKLIDPLLESCDETLPQLNLSRLLLGKGDPVDVTPTNIAQPLLLAHGVAHYNVWRQLNNTTKQYEVQYGMGHSLGEYTALVSSGLLTFSDGLKLVRSRGEAMSMASSQALESTGMTVIVSPRNLDSGIWSKLLIEATRASGVDIAAFNSPSLTVVSGDQHKIDEVVQFLKSHEQVTSTKSRFIAKKLPVSGAFHSKYMEPASRKLESLVSNVKWNDIESSEFSVISNITGKPYTSTDEIKQSCVAALTNPVKWLQSIDYVDSLGVSEFIAMGGDIHKLMEKDVKASSSVFN